MAAPSRRTSTSSIRSTGMTTCGTPLLMKWTLLFLSPTRSVTFSRKSVGSVISSVTKSSVSSAAITPARVSKEIFSCVSAILLAKRAKQRAPLPHISASPPSLLKYRMRKSAPLAASSSNKIPSAPIPRCRSQRRAIWLRSRWTSPARLSIRTKSFPAPFIFVKRSIRFHLAYSGGTANRRCQLQVWRLLIPREKTGCFGFHRGFGTDHRDSVCWRLQRIDSRSDQTNAQGRSLFRFAVRQDPPAILSAFRVRQVFYSAFGGLAEFLLGRHLPRFHQDARGFAHAGSASARFCHFGAAYHSRSEGRRRNLGSMECKWTGYRPSLP